MRSGNEDIWIKPLAGRVALLVTSDPASDIYAVRSPDGTQVAFASDRGGATNVATLQTARRSSLRSSEPSAEKSTSSM